MTAQAELTRYRIRFAKRGVTRFVGHLDLQRTWERTFRRAGILPAYSKGYHPRPRMQFAAALPLGLEGERELVDFWLADRRPPAELAKLLRASCAPGITIGELCEVPSGAPSLPKQVLAAEYRVRLSSALAAALPQRVQQLLEQASIPRERRGKPYDLRPLIESLALEHDDGGAQLRMRLVAREGANGRPEEVLASLELDPAELLIRRDHLVLQQQPASPAPPVGVF